MAQHGEVAGLAVCDQGVHFVVLNSHDTDAGRRAAELTWLDADLTEINQNTNQKWIIVYWHHPPYSKGTHNSDNVGQESWMR